MVANNERAILKNELRWAAVVAGAVGLIVVVIVASSLTMAIHPPSNVETIDPATLHIDGEFVEANLGSRRIEHWDNAVSQGKHAGRNMAGAREPFNYMPFFFSDLFEFGYAGFSAEEVKVAPGCRRCVRGGRSRGKGCLACLPA